jgi:hypothetical protein
MANPGTQQNAINTLTDWVNLANQFWSLYTACKTMYQRQAQHGYVALYNATSTYAVNADGSPGATDGSPNNAHPMQGTYLTANQISGFDGYAVNHFIDFVEGNAVATADRRPAIQQMLP